MKLRKLEEEGEICFETYICMYKESKSKGKTLSLLTVLFAISKYLAERIAKEKEASLEKAENIVIDCVKDGMKTIDV